MIAYLNTYNTVLGILVVIAQVDIVVLIIMHVFRKQLGNTKIYRWTKTHGLAFGCMVALIAMIGSLGYSDGMGFNPCRLCWYQRILMYPLVVILGIAAWKKDFSIKKYVLPLATIGLVIALYHYLMQIGVAPSLPCSAIGISKSCSERFVTIFGYITIPLMAATAFAYIIALVTQAKPAEELPPQQ